MITIRQAFMPEQRAVVHELFTEYLRWVCPRIYEEYQAVFEAEYRSHWVFMELIL